MTRDPKEMFDLMVHARSEAQNDPDRLLVELKAVFDLLVHARTEAQNAAAIAFPLDEPCDRLARVEIERLHLAMATVNAAALLAAALVPALVRFTTAALVRFSTTGEG